MQGFLNFNKPKDWTSHDCVAKVRRLLHLKRVGHAGTLDPAATGVLPIALGRATRLLQFLRQDKAYRARIRFGIKTTTNDLEGEILTTQPVSWLTLEAIHARLQQFQGEIQQIPPSYSAIQVQGKRLYDLARAGRAVEAPARTVAVHQLEIIDWQAGDFPELELAIACGPGTYIRAIARDLGVALNTGGTLAALIRTHSSGFSLTDSLTLEELEAHIQAGTFNPVLPEVALAHLEPIFLPVDLAKRWCQGQKIDWDQKWEQSLNPWLPNWRIHREDGQFLGVGQRVAALDGAQLIPQMVFEPIY